MSYSLFETQTGNMNALILAHPILNWILVWASCVQIDRCRDETLVCIGSTPFESVWTDRQQSNKLPSPPWSRSEMIDTQN